MRWPEGRDCFRSDSGGLNATESLPDRMTRRGVCRVSRNLVGFACDVNVCDGQERDRVGSCDPKWNNSPYQAVIQLQRLLFISSPSQRFTGKFKILMEFREIPL